jgi:hypothetical protein
MNDSLITADRSTHLKIALLALVAATIVVLIASSARSGASDAGMQSRHSLLQLEPARTV